MQKSNKNYKNGAKIIDFDIKKFRNALLLCLLLNFEQSKCDIYLLLYACDRAGYCYGGYAIATVVCGWYVDVFNSAAVWQCKFVV